MNDTTIGVIAGTLVDTQMGIDFVKSKGLNAIGKAISKTPEEQTVLQVLHKKELAEIFINIANELIDKGAQSIMVYCNSLSGAIDLGYIKSKVLKKIVTPLDIYENTAKEFDKMGILAANGQSIATIENVILKNNSNCVLCGAMSIFLVKEIESGKPSSEIYNSLNIKGLVNSFERMGISALILGCTHFPFIEKEIKENTNLKIINQGDHMIKLCLM